MRRSTRQAIRLGCGFWLGGVLMAGAAAISEPVRVALVTLEQGENARGVLDLATAKLSAEPGVEMLERQTIDTLLREQEWSLAGLVSAADAVRAGRVLGTDVLVILQSTATEQPLVVAAFQAATGVRLVHHELPLGDPAVQAERLVELCNQAIHKARNPDQFVRTLSVLAIQDVDLPDQQDYLLGALGYLLERQLIQSPGIAILERERLEALNTERALSSSETTNALWTSAHVLELDVSRGEQAGEIRVFVRITDPAGNVHGEFARTGPADAEKLGGAIQNELVRLLEMEPPPEAPAREVEAQRYRREAEAQLQQKQYPLAIRAAEAAYALNPDDLEIVRSLARCHFEYADTQRESGVPYLLKQLQWLDLLTNKFGDTSQVGFLEGYLEWRCPSADPNQRRGRGPIPLHLVAPQWVKSQVEYREWLRKLQLEYARYLGLSPTRTDGGPPGATPLIKSLEPRWAMRAIAMAAPDRDLYLQFMSEYVRWWTAEVERQPDLMKDFRLSEAMRFMREMAVQSHLDDHSWFERDTLYYDGLRGIYGRMAEHPVVYMSLYGRLGMLYCDLQIGRISPADMLTQVHALDAEVRARIMANGEGEEIQRKLLYLFLLDTYDQIADLDERQLLFHGLFGFMLNQWTLVPAVGHAATVPYTGFRRDGNIQNERPLSTNHYPRLLQNASRYLAAIQNRDQYYVYPEWEWIRRELERTENAVQVMRETIGLPTSDHPWTEAVRIMDLKEVASELARIEQVYLEGDDLYVLASKLDFITDQGIALFKVDPQTRMPQRVFGTTFSWRDHNPKRLGTICRHQGNTYIPTHNSGVLVVSDDGSHHWIKKEAGLPSDQVQSMAVMGGALYIASGEEGREAYLSRYDISTEQWSLLAAANRRERIGPLDQILPYVIRGIAADSGRGRLVFALDYDPYYLTRRGERNDMNMPLMGLWTYSPQDGTFKQILPMNRSPLWVKAQGERLLVAPWNCCPYQDWEYNQTYGLMFHDINKDANGVVYYAEKRPVEPSLMPTASAIYAPERMQEPPYAVQRDGVWFAKPLFGRHLFSGEIQFYPDAFPDKGQAKCVNHLIPGRDGATLIVATDTQVWLFKRDPSVAMRDEDWEALIAPVSSEVDRP